MTVYVITYFAMVLYYMITCAHDDDTSNTWPRVVLRGVMASVIAVFWPLTVVRWIYLDARALATRRKG